MDKKTKKDKAKKPGKKEKAAKQTKKGKKAEVCRICCKLIYCNNRIFLNISDGRRERFSSTLCSSE